MSKLETNTIDTVSGTTNLTIGSTNTSTITMPNGALTGQNYPAFSVYLNATSSGISSATWTKVTSFVEEYDTDSAFASDKFTVPSGKAGKYMIQAQCRWNVSGSTSNVAVLKIRVNGSDGSPMHIENAAFCNGSANARLNVNGIYDLSVGDYVEMVVYQNITTANLLADVTWFQGYRIGS